MSKPTETVVLINKFFAVRYLDSPHGIGQMCVLPQYIINICDLVCSCYGSRFMMYHFLRNDPKSDMGRRFKLMMILTRDCRKILRLFKWIGEYEKLEKLINQANTSGSTHSIQIQIVGTLGMAAYWFFDNLTFLVKGGMLLDDERYAKLSMLGWWVGISCNMIIDTQSLIQNLNRETQLRAALGLPAKGMLDMESLSAATQKQQLESKTMTTSSTSSSSPTTSSSQHTDDLSLKQRQELLALYQARMNLLLNYIKNGGDWIISANGSDIIPQILGYSLNDGIIGIAGTVSGLATMVQVVRQVSGIA